MPKRAQPSRLLDAIAEALILADAGEPASLVEVAAAADAASRAAKRSKAPWSDEARAFAAEARAIGSLTPKDVPAALEELGRRFGSLQSRMDAREEPSRRSSPPDQRAESPAKPPTADATPLAGDEELLRDFVARAGEHLEAADEALLVLEREPSDPESMNAVFRAFHTIKGMAGFLALTDIEHLAHDAESVLDGPRKGAAPLDAEGFEVVFGAVDAMKRLVAAVLAAPAASAAGADGTGMPASDRPARRSARGAVRVDEERLDRLLDTIGELVIAEAMFSEAARSDDVFRPLAQQLVRVDKITRELQEMATSLRMVPLRSTFVRMARLVRDTAHKAGKAVDFVTTGEDTELDKLVVDRIGDPLIHILRNAVDHGVETPAERRASGKPETGRVELRAYHAGGGIHIEVTDDGAGFDEAALVAAAQRAGLLDEAEVPAGREALELAFAPGLSTARTVTDVSGRGVGMDVVRRTVEGLRGQVEIASRPGRGVTVSIRLPLTLAIIDGIVVRVGSERYIIPTLSIERSVRPAREQLSSIVGRGEVVNIDDRLIPLVHLHRLFAVEDAEADPTRGIVVIVGQNGDRAGLVACEILGQQQIVIKTLGEAVSDTPGIAGGAIMPDGRVGLIVDVGGLVKLARS